MQPTRNDAGATLGILMLNSTFRRYLGDIGNARTWSFPVKYKIVEDANPSNVIGLRDTSLLEPFKRAADDLIAEGVDGITTTCGLLSIYQKDLAAHCRVPVATSSLLQVPMVERMLPHGKRVGILTYSAATLNGPYLDAVGVAQDTPVVGMAPDSNFVRWIRDGDNAVSYATLREEVVTTAQSLRRRHPEVGALVLECTNLAPFSADIVDRLGIPVYDTVTMVNAFHASLSPRRYPND
ncbi:aspartate/glutamate racemase family protein [Undibacter mobilis]|uniref:Aspartate/glutamate racemase family protein n=1 Tax=Undibacter mobilis TaxID=2292256 RepID=A0A371B1F4_9BRAD|nr:aspartate/glutamate racemase family protein [Undibacter mobilis]RDV01334.1 aspartate/glutamate racemase family protein [Undibacter mobilis]